MDKHQNRQRKKNEALNKIRKIYNPNFKFDYSQYGEESFAEQREEKVREIIETLERELKS